MKINRLGKEVSFPIDMGAIERLQRRKTELGERFPRVGIMIISYNASQLLRETVERIPLGLLDVIEEIFVFDDASKDDTFEVAQNLLTSSPWRHKLNVFKNPKNRGYGGNQKIGFRYAIERKLDFVVMLHGDGQYAPEHLPELIEPGVLKSEQVVFGSRMMNRMDAINGGMPIYKFIGNQVLTKFENLILGIHLTEYHTGYRMYATEVLKRIPFEENTDVFHFDSEIIVQVRALGAKIAEVPIRTFYGDEVCHVNGFKYALDVCKTVIAYRLHQIHVFRLSQYFVKRDIVYTRKLSPYSSHEQIIKLLDKPGKALDMGAGEGLLTEGLARKGIQSTGVDSAAPETMAGKFHAYIQCNLESPEALHFGREFDYVILADVVEHIRNAETLLKHVRCFLKPNGKVIISVPNIAIWFYRLSLLCGRFNYGDKGILDKTHTRLYTLDSIRQLVEGAGYVVKKEAFTGLPFEVVFESIGRSKLLQMIDALYFLCVKVWPRMFAYQIVLEAQIAGLEFDKGEGRVVVTP